MAGAHDWGSLADDGTARALLDQAMDALPHCDYADARLVECEELRTYRRAGADADERVEHNVGIGVRVLVDGAWGFASAPVADAVDVAALARRAHAVATASIGHTAPVTLPARPAVSGT